MPDARRVLAGGAALLALAGAGCGGEKADLTEPAMALPRLTVAMVAVDLRGGDRAQAGALARAAGYRSPLVLAAPAARAGTPSVASCTRRGPPRARCRPPPAGPRRCS